jgi:hypothetical protein
MRGATKLEINLIGLAEDRDRLFHFSAITKTIGTSNLIRAPLAYCANGVVSSLAQVDRAL